jgi:DNA-binding IclR family transcriptional regulator
MVRTKTVGSNSAAKKKDFLRRYLEEKRCAMTRELLEALGTDKTTLRRLLLQLESEGAVKSRKVGRVVLWCVP